MFDISTIRVARAACLALSLLAGLLQAATFQTPPNTVYITYLPGTGRVYSAIDTSGFQYIGTNQTSSCPLPAPNLTAADGVYGSVTKLQSGGTGATWIACLPGSVGGLALDGSGSIYIANNEGGVSTVTKLTPDASKIVYSTAIQSATTSALAVDPSGNVYFGGTATAGLPTTPGASQPVQNCTGDPSSCSFIAKLGPTGAVLYATYYNAAINGIAATSRGEAWVVAETYDSFYGFQGGINKLDSSGQLAFGLSFLGYNFFGANHAAPSLAVDGQDSLYVVGYGAISTDTGSIPAENPYIAKFDDSGKLLYRLYRTGYEDPGAIAVDANGYAYVALIESGPTQASAHCAGGTGSKLMVLNADASQVLATWEVAGQISAISQDGAGGVYVGGITGTSAFLVTPGAYVKQYPSGAGAGFAAKFDVSQPAAPSLSCLTNGASWWPGRNTNGLDGSVAPGEIVSLFGQGFQPDSGLSVTFDGVAAPILYAGTGQINAVVPFKTGAAGSVTLVSINHGSQVIGPYQLPVSAAAPGIFSTGPVTPTPSLTTEPYEPNSDALFGGQALALNQDGSVNSSTRPAAPGSIVSIFATGAGAYSPSIADGALGPIQPPFPTPILGVGALFLGSPSELAQVLFAGQAPGLPAGVVQVNLVLPADLPSGVANVAVLFGNYSSPYASIFVGN